MEWLARHFELSRGGTGHNVSSMEGLRGFAVFLVFLVHYVTLVNPWVRGNSTLLQLSEIMHKIGNSGVDLFFVMSGYLIYGTLISREQKFIRFISRRIKRIYPVFSVVFLIYVGISLFLHSERKIPGSLAAGVLYLIQNFLLLPGIFPITPLITVSWSLSYEMLFYWMIPLVVILFDLRHRSTAWRSVFFILVTVFLVVNCAIYGGPIRLAMFISGILLHEAMTNPGISPPGSAVALLALLAGLMSTLIPFSGLIGYIFKTMMLFAGFFILCFTCFSHSGAWIAKIFSWTPLRWLGNMSYSYYLLHGLVLKIGFMLVSTMLPPSGSEQVLVFWGMFPFMLLLTLVSTMGLFIFIERPFSLVSR
ncbi:MAG: acyltransferase [Betaproteobacteria bacterium]|jgi:Predicted acyltransferases|nr:acyltransferase [Betaproteobacteria bacterium]